VTTVAHVASVLREARKLVVNIDPPFLDKAQRVRVAEDALTGAIGFLDEIIAAHPEECAGHWGKAKPSNAIDHDGPLYVNDVQPDEIDLDPEGEGLLEPFNPDVTEDDADPEPTS